jgi:hypothetical protein
MHIDDDDDDNNDNNRKQAAWCILLSCLPYYLILKMRVMFSTKISVSFESTACDYIPDDRSFIISWLVTFSSHLLIEQASRRPSMT